MTAVVLCGRLYGFINLLWIGYIVQMENGAIDGTRTHDNSDHNRGLYQLSYSRHTLIIMRIVVNDRRVSSVANVTMSSNLYIFALHL